MHPHTRLRPGPFCAFQAIDGRVVIVSTRDRIVHTLDETGSVLWAAVEAQQTFEEAVERLVSTYEVERPAAEEDARAFLEDLVSQGLVEAMDAARAIPEIPR